MHAATGRSLEGKSSGNGESKLLSQHGSAQGYLALPDASSGAILTSGLLPTLQRVSVLSAATVTEALEALGDTTLGHRLETEAIHLSIPLAGLEALRLGGKGQADARGTRGTIVQASAAGLGPGVLHLPDASGVVLVSSSVPTTRRNATFEQRVTASGGTVFDGQHLHMGWAHDGAASALSQPPLSLSLEHANLITPQGLFLSSPLSPAPHRDSDSTSSTSEPMSPPPPPAARIGVEEPTGERHVWLPDVSGTILTSDQMRDNGFEQLRIQQNFDAQGSLHLQGDTVAMGARGSRQESFLSLNARLIGGMTFDCDSPSHQEARSDEGTNGAAVRHKACLSVQRAESQGDNVLRLPDASGTVLTTGNLPNPVVTPGPYALSADTILVSGAEGVEVGAVWEDESAETAVTARHSSGFVFTDALPLPLSAACPHSSSAPAGGAQGEAAQGATTNGDNQFVAIVRGGVRFETGVTPVSGKALGSLLAPGASAWYVSHLVSPRIQHAEALPTHRSPAHVHALCSRCVCVCVCVCVRAAQVIALGCHSQDQCVASIAASGLSLSLSLSFSLSRARARSHYARPTVSTPSSASMCHHTRDVRGQTHIHTRARAHTHCR